MSNTKPKVTEQHPDKHSISSSSTGSPSGSKITAPKFIATGEGRGGDQPRSSSAGTPAEKPNLTFGIELEFIFVSLEDRPDRDRFKFAKYRDSDMLALEIVLNALKEKMRANCRVCDTEVAFDLPTQEAIGSCLPTGQGRYEVWNVINERLKMTPEEDNSMRDPWKYYAQGVEINSRILSYEEDLVVPDEGAGHNHRISCEQEIEAVLRKLQERFCKFDPNSTRYDYLYPSRDCALHVHVGQQQAGFETGILRKLLSLNLAAERHIDELHSVNRITGGDLGIKPLKSKHAYADGLKWIDAAANNAPLSFSFLQSTFHRRQDAARGGLHISTHHVHQDQYPERWFAYDPDLRQCAFRNDADAWMALVNSAPTVTALRHLYGSNVRNATVSLDNLVHDSPKRTVEFRQASGTLNAKAIFAWVDVVLQMVSFSRNASRESLENLCGRNGSLRKPTATYVDLCKALGCKKETLDHYDKRDKGDLARNLRHVESKMAREAKHDPLSTLALKSIEDERFRLHLSNVKRRINEKLIYGAYGQFPGPVVDALVPSDTSEEVRERITLGFENPVTLENFVGSKFSKADSRPGSSGSEASFTLGTPLTGGPLPTLHLPIGQASGAEVRPGHELYGNFDRNRDVSPGPLLGSPLIAVQNPPRSSSSGRRAEAAAELQLPTLPTRGRSSPAQRPSPSQRPSSSQQPKFFF